ncbi:MAG: hypothetical protein SGI97_04355 [candidate division Zixibacteria bacterium]|nr:hypothetical protein [candidate division Zixibacteria bacterium]
MTRQAGVFTRKAKVKEVIANRLGWVDSATLMSRKISEIESFGQKVFQDGFNQIVLMGMGGSSLCPESLYHIFGGHKKLKVFHVLDTTDPRVISRVARSIDLKKTLFIVASKSGGTIETRSHEAFFIERLKQNGLTQFGKQFVAITDKNSDLHAFAKRNKYRAIFLNPSDIGGRYSALSYFGLVPAFFVGVNLSSLIDSALSMQNVLSERNDETNPALALGSLMAVAAQSKRDKLTFLSSKKISPLVPWIEQLVAESTGKEGKGVIPIENEPEARVQDYGTDRLFVFMRMSKEKPARQSNLLRQIIKKKLPYIEIVLGSIEEISGQFLLWELATAVCGWHMGINPFDEPNVTESKNRTKQLLDYFEKLGHFPFSEPAGNWGKCALLASLPARKVSRKQPGSLRQILAQFLASVKPPQYVAILNYFPSSEKTEIALRTIRSKIRSKTKAATLRGYGPRFLHSIGQLYKGGAAEGMFIILVSKKYPALAIPNQSFDFGELITAQAFGDAQALIVRKLPTLVLSIDGDPVKGLKQVAAAL